MSLARSACLPSALITLEWRPRASLPSFVTCLLFRCPSPRPELHQHIYHTPSIPCWNSRCAIRLNAAPSRENCYIPPPTTTLHAFAKNICQKVTYSAMPVWQIRVESMATFAWVTSGLSDRWRVTELSKISSVLLFLYRVQTTWYRGKGKTKELL